MEKKVKTQTNIFNENKSDNKIVKITFMFLAMIFASWQSEAFAADANDPNLVVPVVCADGNSNQKYEQCAKSCNNVSGSQVSIKNCTPMGGDHSGYNCNGSDTYQYMTTNSIGVSFSQQCSGNGRCYDGDITKNAVINQCKASCEFFKNQCSSYIVEIDTVKFLEAMPEIGISRVDPNLIEY